MRLLGVILVAATLSAQAPLPPPFPRTNATRLLDTDRIAVWDIVWPIGQPTALHRHVNDQVGTYYARGGRRITMPDGTFRTAMTEVGSLSTTRKGTTHIEEGTTDPPLRAIFIELKKDTPSTNLPEIPRDLPTAFPRAGATRLRDDERVTVWDYTWQPGSPRVTYRVANETFIVYLGDGKLRLTPGDGAAGTLEAVPGKVRSLRRGTVETEEGTEGTPRALVFELK